MSTIGDVGRKMLESERKFKWKRMGHMCYATVVGDHLFLVKRDMFQIRLDGVEIDAFRNPIGTGSGTWIRGLWKRAHDAVLAQEHFFEGILQDLE